jgi:hypothetical protein
MTVPSPAEEPVSSSVEGRNRTSRSSGQANPVPPSGRPPFGKPTTSGLEKRSAPAPLASIPPRPACTSPTCAPPRPRPKRRIDVRRRCHRCQLPHLAPRSGAAPWRVRTLGPFAARGTAKAIAVAAPPPAARPRKRQQKGPDPQQSVPLCPSPPPPGNHTEIRVPQRGHRVCLVCPCAALSRVTGCRLCRPAQRPPPAAPCS